MARLYLFYVIIASLHATGLLQEEEKVDKDQKQILVHKVVSDVDDRSRTYSSTHSSTTVRQHRDLCYSNNDFSTVMHMKNFVDKTMFIKNFFLTYDLTIENKVTARTVFTGPPRFGKSTLLDMMKQFVQIPLNDDKTPMTDLNNSANYRIFCNETHKLKITSEKDVINRHCGKYLVINVDFSSTPPENANMEEYFIDIMRYTYSEYEWLYRQYCKKNKNSLDAYERANHDFFYKILTRTANVYEVNIALAYLRDMLYEHFGNKIRIFLLVDEYDSPGFDVVTQNSRYEAQDVQRRVNIMLRNALKGMNSDKIAYAYITGINQVSLNDGPSKMNHADYYGFLRPSISNFHQEYFGFTENEVNTLLNKLRYPSEVQKKVKENFDGYYSPSKKIHIYCTYSVIQFTKHNDLKPYWAGSGLGEFFLKSLYNFEIRYTFLELLKIDIFDFQLGVHIPQINYIFNTEELDDFKKCLVRFDDEESVNYYRLFYKYIYDLGYLTNANTSGDYYRIPNVEIRNFCLNQMKSYYDEVKHVDMALLGDIMFNILQLKTVDENYLSDCELEFTHEFRKIRSTERTVLMELMEFMENVRRSEFEYHAIVYVASAHRMGFECVKGVSRFDKARRTTTSATRKDVYLMLLEPSSEKRVLVVEIKSYLQYLPIGEKNWNVDTAMDQAQEYEPPKGYEDQKINCLAMYIDQHGRVQLKFEPKRKTTIINSNNS